MCVALGIAVICLCSSTALAASGTLQYTMAPGQVWIATTSTQSESAFMGTKDVNRTKSTIEYTVSSGPKKGWVTLTARITSQSGAGGEENDGGMDLSKLRFTAEMHQSGELRNIQSSGSALPPMEAGEGELPPGMVAMYEQSSRMIADAWKNGVFWFPELPGNALAPGDEFEVSRKMGMGNESAGMQMESVSKQVFTLEEVNDGLAYFSVKERTLTKSSAAMGGTSDTKTAGKGEAVFDLKGGMWTDLTTKSRSEVQLGNIPGMGKGSQEVHQITKIRMEKK